MTVGRTTLEDGDERLSGTYSSSSASTDLPPLNSEMQADAARVAAMLAGTESAAHSSFGGALSSNSEAPFTFVRILFYLSVLISSTVCDSVCWYAC